LNEILERYHDLSNQLEEDFFAEFQIGIQKALANPVFPF